MRAVKTEELLWSKEELLGKIRQAPDEQIRSWALQWLFKLFGKEKDVQAVFQKELSRFKTDYDLSRFPYMAETLFALLTEQENLDVNGPFLLEKARQFFQEYFQEKRKTWNLFLLSLWALSRSGYQPGLAFLQEILRDLCQAYRGSGSAADTAAGADAEAELPRQEKERLLREIAGVVSVAALYALREPLAYREIFAPLLSEVEDDHVLWLHVAGGAIKGGDYALVEPFTRRYLSIPAEKRLSLKLHLFFSNLLGVGSQLKILYKTKNIKNQNSASHDPHDSNGSNESNDFKDDLDDYNAGYNFHRFEKSSKKDGLFGEFMRLRRLSVKLLKPYPELVALLEEKKEGEEGEEEGDRPQYYRQLYDLTLQRLEKEGLLGYFSPEKMRGEEEPAFLEKLHYSRLLFLKVFSEHAAAAQIKKKLPSEEEAGEKAALQEFWRTERLILLFNALFLLKFSFLRKKRPNFFRRQFWEKALDFLQLTPELAEREAFEEELLASLDGRDIAFFARTAAAVKLLEFLDDNSPRLAGVNFKVKKRKESSAVPCPRKERLLNYLSKKALLAPFPEKPSALFGPAAQLDAAIVKMEVFAQGQNSILLLEEYAHRAPEKLLPHFPLLVELYHNGLFSYPLLSIIDEMGEKAFIRLKQLYASSRREKKRTLLSLFSLFPFVRTRDLFLQNWDKFYSLAPDEVLNVVEGLADPAFLPFLLQEWKAKNREAAGLILFICDLHQPGDLPPELPQIKSYYQRELQLEEEIAATLDSKRSAEEKMIRIQRLKPYVELTLRCCICGKIQRQRFEALNIVEDFYNTANGDLLSLKRTAFPHEFVTCIRCGAVNNYAYTPKTEKEILEELELFDKIVSSPQAEKDDAGKKQEYDDPYYPRLRFITLDWKDDSGENLSPLEALDYFSRKIEENPQIAEYQRGLAEVFSFFQRYEQAELYFARARRLAPDDPAIYYAEGFSNLERGDYKKARRLFRQFLRLAEALKEAEEQEIDILAEKQKRAAQMEQEELKEKIELARKVLELTPGFGKEEGRSVPVDSNQPRVGRNDPCPCGSGKKYKKCCGR